MQGLLKSTVRTVGVAVAGAAIPVGFAGPGHAAGGYYEASTKDRCAHMQGHYYYDYVAHRQGRATYNTRWDFTIDAYSNSCGWVRSFAPYATYSKWTGTKWDYSHTNKYTRIGTAGTGRNVADVMIYLCEVGKPSTCGRIHGA
ncbi:hypothetical protein AB0N81_36865 [Streptomyces sp. NPDC093510]|uniref:hypothetical protein n=1 Tax=Streptomyces sp. NPDC093510 TaxID=3155199 RepID=UPI003438115B